MSAAILKLPTAAPEKISNPRKYGPWKKSGDVDGSYWPRLQARRKAEYLIAVRENARRCQEYQAVRTINPELEITRALQGVEESLRNHIRSRPNDWKFSEWKLSFITDSKRAAPPIFELVNAGAQRQV